MKKLLLFTVVLSFYLGSFAQNKQKAKTIYDLKSSGPLRHVNFSPAISGGEVSPVNSKNVKPVSYSPKVTLTTSNIGSTTYDLQSNAAPVCGRVYKSGTTVGAAWTFSTDANATWPDRGTGVNYSNDGGATWGPAPTLRVETARTGFGTLDKLGAGEVIVSHGWTATNPIPMGCYYRATAGSGTWAKISDIPGPVPGFIEDLWASMRTGGANGNSIHVVALTVPTGNSGDTTQYLGVDGMLLYYRSTDGGLTWDIQNFQLPGMDALHYVRVRANAYSIDVHGDVVAVVACGMFDDWNLWKSTDNGTTWTQTVIYDFPKTRYDYDTDTTDIDGDGIADLVPTTDGTCAVVIDNNNVVHCFAGAEEVMQTMGGTANISIATAVNAILYWNETMGAVPAVVAAQAPDLDGDLIITDNGSQYGFVDNVCSMPTAGVDQYNNIYLAYSATMEGTLDVNGLNYRNIWAQASNDNGATWLPAFNVSNSNFDEGVYPSMARDVEIPGCLHVIWQQDPASGTTANATTPLSSANDIFYGCVDPIADLGITVGIKENSTQTIGISISPNPAGDFALIKFVLEKPVTVEMEILNITGQRVAQIKQDVNAGNQNIRINTSKFSKGVYSVNSKIDGKVFTNKLVIK